MIRAVPFMTVSFSVAPNISVSNSIIHLFEAEPFPFLLPCGLRKEWEALAFADYVKSGVFSV